MSRGPSLGEPIECHFCDSVCNYGPGRWVIYRNKKPPHLRLYACPDCKDRATSEQVLAIYVAATLEQ